MSDSGFKMDRPQPAPSEAILEARWQAGDLRIDWRIEKTGAYRSWKAMQYRCKKDSTYTFRQMYYLRGITICDEWMDFWRFYQDMGGRPSGGSIDRIDNDQGYRKDNCRWIEIYKQGRNTRRSIRVQYQGRSLCAHDIAEILHVDVFHVYKMRKAGGLGHEVTERSIKCLEELQSERIEYKGQIKTIKQWADMCEINPSFIRTRLYKGMSSATILGQVLKVKDQE